MRYPRRNLMPLHNAIPMHLNDMTHYHYIFRDHRELSLIVPHVFDVILTSYCKLTLVPLPGNFTLNSTNGRCLLSVPG